MEEIKILAIGDLHGRSCWQAIQFDQYDKIVFLGDYVDSEHYGDREILSNFRAVIDLKKTFPEKVVLILGNHDIQYLYYPKYSCSGFRPTMQPTLTEIYNRYHHLFQIAYQINNYLFSHAGISLPWHEEFIGYLGRSDSLAEMAAEKSLATVLNAVDQTAHRDILHQVGIKRGGSREYGGITWADREELWDYPLEGYHQVVGHTPVPYIEAFSYNEGTSITFVDVLGSQEEYYEIGIQWQKENIGSEGLH